MKRNKPLPPKRATPRRKAPERVQHARAKPKAGAEPTAIERRHMERIRELGCLVCRRPATIHHVTGYADKPGRFARAHWLTVPLCAVHHQKVHDPKDADPVSVEGLGHQGFYRRHGIDLLDRARRLWKETQEEFL